MITKPNTPAREKEVDRLLSTIRQKMIEGEFRTVSITFDTVTEPHEDGLSTVRKLTGDFTMRVEV